MVMIKKCFCMLIICICFTTISCNKPTTAPVSTNPVNQTAKTAGSNVPSAADLNKKIKFEFLSMEPLKSSEKVKVKFKMTNLTANKIVSANATISVLDENNTPIGAETHWVIRSEPLIRDQQGNVSGGAGGLEANQSMEEDFTISVSDKAKAKYARFEVLKLSGG